MSKVLYDLTNPQKTIWYIEQFYKGSTLNNICGNIFIDDIVNFNLLEKSANLFVKNNDSFRLRLTYDKNNEVKQYVSDFENFKIEIVNINSQDDISSIEQEMCAIPFNLIENDLFKFKAFRLPDGKGGLILLAHHLIYDAYSASIVANKVVDIYSSLLKGEEVIPVPSSYTEYMQSEKKYLSSNKFLKDKEYWTKVFESVPEVASIPSFNDSLNNSCKASRKSFIIPKNKMAIISDFCSKNKISNYDFFMALYAIYIGRVSGLNDFVLGSPILNRSNSREKNIPGMFISTVAFRFILNKENSFVNFSKKIASNAFSIFRHQKYPYQYILDNLRKNNPSQPNLYDILISYQNAKANCNGSSVPFKTSWAFNNNIADSMQIHLADMNDEGILNISYDYRINKYSDEDIEALHSRVLNMIEQVLCDENISVENISIVTPKEEKLILTNFNNTSMRYNKEKTVVDYFEEQVRKTPNNIAIVCNSISLSYKELNEKANQLSHYLIKNGVKKNDIVGIMVKRSPEMIVGLLAILKSGATYLPLDPEYPEERISYIIKDSNCTTVLVHDETYKLIDDKFNKINISLNSTTFSSKEIENLNIKVAPTSLIYVIYTSGSTGNPKGVMIMHKNISNFILAEKKYIDFSSKKVMLSVTTMCFDIFALEIWCSLTSGMKVVIANEEEQLSPNLIRKLCETYNINMIQTTPSRFSTILNGCENLDFFNNFSDVMVGGEPFPKALLEMLKKITKANIWNMYGPTETTVWSTIKNLTCASEISIGRPISNTTCYILDKNKKLLPPNVAGELYIGGDGVTAGYLNREALTKEKFISSPFRENEIIYDTNDLAYFTDSGELVHLGRTDFQVKIRGYRIELEEIENKIIKFNGISSCVVCAVDNSTKLCAYYIANNDIDLQELRAYLSKVLPNYMIPNYYVKMDSFPYTPNGKINKKALPKPTTNISKNIIAPRNDIDKYLVGFLKSALNLETISIADSFFDIGGDSLTAINLSTNISNIYSIDFAVKDIFEHPILKDISDFISKAAKLEKTEKIIPVQKKEFYEVSSAQKRIYFASKVAGDNSILYNIPGGIILDGNIDAKKLEECVVSLIKRHESLRTYFVLSGDDVVQKILEDVDFKLDIDENMNFETLDSIFKSFVKPFNLEEAPLFRMKYISCTNGKTVVLLDMHHIISDGFSVTIFIDELCKLYNNAALNKLDITYKDYANFENNKLFSGGLDNAQNYWINQFKDGIPVLNLPTSRPRPAIQSFDGNRIYRSISKEISAKIDNLAKNIGVTPYMVLLCAYYILLSKYTSQEEIIVGTPIENRGIPQTHNLIGMFVNTLALRERIDSNSSFKDFVTVLKSNLLEAYKYENYPFDELVNKLNITRDTSRNPLFDTMFIYQNNSYKDLSFNNIKSEYYVPDVNISKFDLSLEAVPTKNEINLTFEYATKLFDEDFIRLLSEHYLNILNVILNNCDIKISDIDMLSEKEENKILFDFNNTHFDYDKTKTVSMLFEEQVEKTPDNVAVVFGDEKLTFKELNEKANSLAYYLREKENITNDSIVGIMVHRSLEVIVAILAVMKAGGAYIPIDPNFPKDRVDYMLDSSHANVLLTQKDLISKINFNNKLAIDLNSSEIYKLPSKNLKNINKPLDLVYLIFTSGSTGKPKGVMVTHRVFTNFTVYCNNYVDYLKNREPLSIVSITTVSFDIFVYETIISLQRGLKVVIANENEQTTPQLLNALMEKNNIEVIQSTPSIMQIFINNLESMPALKKLKYVIQAGEQLPINLVHSLHKLGNITVYNGYGPSETYYFTLTKMNDDIITIGQPIYNSQMYILNKNLRPVPVNVVGEIYISGECVGRGYLNNPELTSKSFISNPFIPGVTMYKSGDLGMYLTNGDIICLGRVDHQIKIRGLRIELGEIESLISNYPNINKVTVVKQSVGSREFISAYYVASKRVSNSELRSYLSKALPKYMVPSYYIALDDLPYTPNGKVDKKALPLPTDLSGVASENYVAPKTELQKQLVSLFEKILNTKPVGINNNFFELGGDSLLAMSLNVELQKITNRVTYSDIFRFSTVAELEEKINSGNELEPMLGKIENISDSYLNILNNSTKKEKITKYYHPKGVLLTGATGFLGIHILQQFIENENSNIYCIIREDPGITPKSKLIQKLHYYFGDKYDKLIDNRIFAITGNIIKPGFGISSKELLDIANCVDVVINSAANVAHYGNYSQFYETNVTSVKYIINFCKKYNKKFYQISTTGVSGSKLDSSLPTNKKRRKIKSTYTESNLYVGQLLNNVYTRSKFEAEVCVLDAMVHGLDAYIFRVGNLMPRLCDELFQENILENAFVNRLATFEKLGFIPENVLSYPLEFSPVDCVAEAIYKLVLCPTEKNRIFHLFNKNKISVKRYLNLLNNLGYEVKVLSASEFKEKINTILNDDAHKNLINNLMNDFGYDLQLNYNSDIIMKSDISNKYLKRIGFKWPRISNKYLISFINLLKKVV